MSLLSRSKGPDAARQGQAIAVESIVKKYGDFEAVKGVSFDVKDGEIFGLLGPNGAGKSTLIRMMTTLIPITSGKAFIAGYDVSRDPDAARRTMGVIPQAMTSDIDLTVEENMRIYAKLYGVPGAERERSINELLEAVDLVKWRGAQVKTLSGGMRRRAEIARGLVHNPRIFFLDEPTTGLDPVSRVNVWEMLNTLKGRRNLTILITTHYMDEADRLCDRINGAGGAGEERRGGDQDAQCAEHFARRCLRPLHGTPASRRAGQGLRLRHAGPSGVAAMKVAAMKGRP